MHFCSGTSLFPTRQDGVDLGDDDIDVFITFSSPQGADVAPMGKYWFSATQATSAAFLMDHSGRYGPRCPIARDHGYHDVAQGHLVPMMCVRT
jgi:hypothetical protein